MNEFIKSYKILDSFPIIIQNFPKFAHTICRNLAYSVFFFPPCIKHEQLNMEHSNCPGTLKLASALTQIGRPSQESIANSSQSIPPRREFTTQQESLLWTHLNNHRTETFEMLEQLQVSLQTTMTINQIRQWIDRKRQNNNAKSVPQTNQRLDKNSNPGDDESLFTESDIQIFEIILETKRNWKDEGFLQSLVGILERTAEGRIATIEQVAEWFKTMNRMDTRSGLISGSKESTEKEISKSNNSKVQLLPRRTGWSMFYNQTQSSAQGNPLNKW